MGSTVFDNVGGSPTPDAPTGTHVTGTSPTTATVAWTAPSNPGFSAITDYQVSISPSSAASTPVQTVGSTATTYTFTGISGGVPVSFSVAAVNTSGAGAASAPSPPVTLAGVATNPPAATLSDTFDGTVLDTSKWSPIGSGLVVNGDLEVPAVFGATAGVVSVGTFDLRGSALAVFVSPGANAGDQAMFEARGSTTGQLLRLMVQGSTLYAFTVSGGVPTQVGSRPYSGGPIWIRFRENSGQTFFEASVDGTVWNQLIGQLATPSYANAVKFALTADEAG
jgi:hypothetical protein